MKKFDGIMLCTDLDGTLLKNDKTISKENHDAIEYFKSEGGIFTFITGRFPYFAEELYKYSGANAPIGCFNGGGIFDFTTHDYLWNITLPLSAYDLAEYIIENIPDVGIQVNTIDNVWFCRENEAMKEFRRATGCPNLFCEYKDITSPVAKIIFGHMSDEVIMDIQKLLKAHPRYSEFDYIRSERTLFEILPQGISKGDVMLRLSKLLNKDIRLIVAVGDYDNDVSMLKKADIGYAVANASDSAKNAADKLTVSNEEHAIAAIIRDLER